MSELVLDSSALVFALTGMMPEASSLRTRISAVTCHAPHLIDAEVGNVLRRQELAKEITPAVAATALRALPHLVDQRYAHTGPLAEAAWKLRGAVTFYDGLYVALAITLGVPLVTADARLSKAPSLPCEVELVG
ncbi:type II toxin-antitoxin system VapC family toxin [Gandjariella thermophila]|uniref:Ribonuclease VapC n=1 Tax=Gandjariella thermophila TaxID=1931992 RepID=A0A4D4JC52_9PSEU|nr:type II toxin-antitoxin system VapC family toxin [Gandjariella thermophila]GDY31443.1 ribonuclease VapC1 [Gandjariella thermophila]